MDLKELQLIFTKCFSAIGGEENRHIKWYRKRPKLISRKTFFNASVWAIWESGMGYKAVNSFLIRAEETGFICDYKKVSSWNSPRFKKLIEKIHGKPIPERAQKKWKSIQKISQILSSFPNDNGFRQSFFRGKVRSDNLDDNDAQFLVNLKLPFNVGKAFNKIHQG